MKKLAMALIFIVPCFTVTYASVEKKVFTAKKLELLKLKNNSGKIKISVSNDGKAYVVANKIQFEEDCALMMKKEAGELIVGVEKRGFTGMSKCRVNFEIKVPRAISLDIISGLGDLSITGTKGEINFKIGSGDVKLRAEVKKLDGKIGSGSIDAVGPLKNVILKAGSGNIKLSYQNILKNGSIDIKTGSGNTALFFPPSMKILTKFKTGSGDVYNELESSSEASFKVSVKTGSGDLKIKTLP